MKIGIIIAVGIGLLLAGAVAVPYIAHREVQSRIGPRHIYELSEQPRTLTVEIALARARDTLTLDGLDTGSWSECNGTRQATSKSALFMFTNGVGSTRFVRVDLQGSQLVCQTSVGK